MKVPEGPEVEEFLEKRKAHEKDLPNVQATIQGSTNIDPIIIDVDSKKEEELLKEAITNIESKIPRDFSLRA